MKHATILVLLMVLLSTTGLAIYGNGNPVSSGSSSSSSSSGGGGGGGGGSSSTTLCTTTCSTLGLVECLGTSQYRSCSFINGCMQWTTINVPEGKQCVNGQLYKIDQTTTEEQPTPTTTESTAEDASATPTVEQPQLPPDQIFTAPDATEQLANSVNSVLSATGAAIVNTFKGKPGETLMSGIIAIAVIAGVILVFRHAHKNEYIRFEQRDLRQRQTRKPRRRP